MTGVQTCALPILCCCGSSLCFPVTIGLLVCFVVVVARYVVVVARCVAVVVRYVAVVVCCVVVVARCVAVISKLVEIIRELYNIVVILYNDILKPLFEDLTEFMGSEFLEWLLEKLSDVREFLDQNSGKIVELVEYVAGIAWESFKIFAALS